MAFVDSQGSIIRVYNDEAGTTPYVVGQVESIGTFAAGTRSERPRTVLSSTALEFGYGLKDNGVFAMVCIYDPNDAGQADILTQIEATEAPRRKWDVELSNGDVHSFIGLVTESPIEIAVDTDLRRTYSVRISGPVTRTPA